MNIESKVCETTTSNISTLLDKFTTFWNEKNIDCFVDMFSENAEFTNVFSKVYVGREEIKNLHERTFNSIYKKTKLTMGGIYARALSEDLVIVTANWESTGNLDDTGKEAKDKKGVIQIIVKKFEEEGYRIILVHNTDITLSASNSLQASYLQ